MQASMWFCVNRDCSSFPTSWSRCGRCAACSTTVDASRSADRFVGKAAATKFCSSRQVPRRDELQRLATEAGFSEVEVRVSRLDIHLPHLDSFMLDHLAGTPVAPLVASADPEARKQIGASVIKQLQCYADGDGVTYPEETHVLTAQVR